MLSAIESKLKTEREQLEYYALSQQSKLNFTPVTSTDSLFNRLIEKYRGKVIYVDFWGTWCEPCLNEMAGNNQLFEYFKGKDVVFLYLAVRSKEKVWKATIANKK